MAIYCELDRFQLGEPLCALGITATAAFSTRIEYKDCNPWFWYNFAWSNRIMLAVELQYLLTMFNKLISIPFADFWQFGILNILKWDNIFSHQHLKKLCFVCLLYYSKVFIVLKSCKLFVSPSGAKKTISLFRKSITERNLIHGTSVVISV